MIKKWSKRFNQCRNCKETSFRHKGYGLCLKCWRISDYAKVNEHRYKTSPKGHITSQNYNKSLRMKALEHYGGCPPVCRCCGEKTYQFLSIDHIYGGGRKHRQLMNSNTYAWLRTNKYPDGFQVLCHNCNLAKGCYGKCPHEEL